MSTIHRPPERPVEGYEAVRDEWVEAVTALMDDAERWSKARGWDVRRQTKPMYESALGSYELPRLLIHNGVGRVLLDPVARDVPGCDGAVDLLSVPDYDGLLITRSWEAWSFHDGDATAAGQPWSEEAFAQAVDRTAKM